MKNKRRKILIISLLIIIFSVVAYISIPNLGIVKAITEIQNSQLELKKNTENLDLVSKITTPANSIVKKFQIYEHRGHSAGIGTSYEAAAGNTGIQDINTFLKQHTNNVRDEALGWYRSLKYDTSIYCIEHGRIFPDIDDILLAMFHIGNSIGGTHDSNDDHLGTDVCDYVEKYYEIACTHKVTATPIDYASGGIETKKIEVSERDLKFDRDGGKYIQHTLVRLEYTPTAIDFETGLAYIVSFNERQYYSSDPSQQAVWVYRNSKEAGTYSGISTKGQQLFNAAMAVEELANPTTPKMKVATDDTLVKHTGTIIDPDNDSNYKIGPIYMNDYQYGWSKDIKEFSGKQSLKEITDKNSEVYKSLTNEEKDFFAKLTEEQKETYKGLVCGIIYAQAELDNGKIIVLDAKNISYSSQDGNRTNFTNKYYESPSLHNYEFPTPNSTFYITIPRADCAGATKINKITMKYKYTTSDGNGGNLSGHFDDLEWTGTKDFDYTQCHYECSNNEHGYNCKNDNLIWSDRSAFPGWSDNVNLQAHTSICGKKGYCEHHWNEPHYPCCDDTYCHGHDYCNGSCYEYDENGKGHKTCSNDCATRKKSPCSRNWCEHGHLNGVHDGECKNWKAHNHLCYGKKGSGQVARNGTYCPEHGNGMHRSCYEFHWVVTKETKNVHSQDLMYVSDAQVYDNFVEAYIENIPLVANVEINKYVYDVNHINSRTITGYDSTMQKGDFRSKLSEDEKQAKPVYSEFGDYVTFKIEIENNSAFGVIVRATDVLPGNATGKDGSTQEAKFYKATFSVNGGKEEVLTIKDLEDKKIQVQANNKASFLVTLIVESLEGTYTNTGKLITRNRTTDSEWKDYVRTIDDNGPIVVVDKSGKEQTKWESRDSYKINDYNLAIEKYVSSYDASVMNENNKIGFTENETSTIGDKFFNNPGGNRDDYEDDLRYGIKEDQRFAQPFEAEKTEQIVYSIRLTNETEELGNADDIARGKKQGTQVRPTKVREILDTGLKLVEAKAMIFGSQGEVKNENVKFTQRDLGNNTYEFEIGNETILDPGDMLIYFVTVEIEENNMFLLNLENSALFTELTNVNHRDHPDDIGDDETKDRIIYQRPGLNTPSIDRNINDDDEITYEYVKQKELIVAGKVFFDDDKNGHLRLEGDEENRFNDLTVNLYRIYNGTETKIGTTKTKINKIGENGFYTFERVDKADSKLGSTVVNDYYQTGGRYQESSGYYEYYIEFEYDGVSYKATEHYGGRHEEVNPNYGDNNIDEAWLPTDGDPYLTDSNAYEFTDVRDEFDEKYETMGYNKAYEEFEKDPSTKKTELTYTKTDHNSMLDVIEAPNDGNHPERVMTARSFIKKDIIAVDGEEQSFKDRGVNKSLDNTKTLWLYSQVNDYKLPETEYLKYINLGLVERENVNVSLTKDLYSITTTINGEQITYDYAQNGVKNNEILIKDDKYLTEEEAQGAQGTELNEENGKYIDAKHYELELYESDYYYRYEDYEHKAVRDYKTQYSELNIEVTFKITITNEEILQDELSMKDPNREVIVTIDEVADFYDEDFVEYTDDIENAYNSIVMADSSVKYTDIDNDPYDYRELTQAEVDGLPSDKAVTIKVKVPDPQTSTDGLEDPDSTKLIDKKLEVVKAWYYKEGETTPTGLRVSNDSIYNTEVNTSQENIYTSDGYRKLYIRGFGQIELEEGESVDIYVRYIVDKEGAEPAKNILTVGEGDSRKLKITEDIKDRLKDLFGRGKELNGNEGGGTEGIAEISAYSTWYQNYDTTGEKAVKVEKPENPDNLVVEVTNADGTVEKDIVHRRPAGLVDKNSNPDNLGERSTDVQYGNEKENMQSVDNVKFYEDDTYKTGITMTVPTTTTPPPTPPPSTPPPDPDPQEFIRTIRGVVWDDSRSTPTDNAGSTEVNTQYSGNGYLNAEDKKNPFAKDNENVRKNYMGGGLSEEQDIRVRNARVDLIEIVQIGNKYYEEVINTGKYLTSLGKTDTTVHQFTTRTNEDGEYVLYGFKPGYYIVRFGYGDYVEGEGSEQIIEDMTIFNGQDYKSTKYTGPLDTDDNDTIIAKLEESNNNDARDDEISRLNTISYSEIMINRKAEILRGSYDDATDEQTKAMIQELLRNTAMNAETVRFIVKPEKMTEEQMANYFTVKPNPNLPEDYIYNDLTNMLNNHIDNRDFAIENVNFGIEYRPESQVNLVKEIDNISLVTSDGQEILKLYVDTKVVKDTTGKVVTREHIINKTKSIGLDNAQFLTNEYEFTERNQQSLEELLAGQGFVFINIDEEILQGSTVTIQYRFTAENISEIDRIGVNLDELRFKDNNPIAYANTETSTLSEMKTDDGYVGKNYNTRFDFLSKALITDKIYRINSDGEIIGTNNLQPANANLYDTEYTAAGTASNILVHQMYKVDENKDIYRTVFKKAYYSQDAYTGVTKGYYGRYLGDYYYTSTSTANDEIAQIKFDKILDYVDNDLVFKATENNMTNGYWGTTTADELRLGGYLSNYDRSNVFSTFEDEAGNDRLGLLDKKGVSYDSVKGTDILRTNLAVSVSDRTKDDEYGEADLEIINKSISRFLTPMSYNRVALSHSIATTEETVSGIKQNPDPYEGQIMLTVSKMVAQETESEDMTYENIAEIIQFTVTSGRRTNFLTTIGNAKVVDGEWTTSTDEPDTSAAERITFTPPTGLTRTDRVIHDVVEKTSTGLMTIGTIAVAVAAVVILVRFVTVKIKKRRIK